MLLLETPKEASFFCGRPHPLKQQAPEGNRFQKARKTWLFWCTFGGFPEERVPGISDIAEGIALWRLGFLQGWVQSELRVGLCPVLFNKSYWVRSSLDMGYGNISLPMILSHTSLPMASHMMPLRSFLCARGYEGQEERWGKILVNSGQRLSSCEVPVSGTKDQIKVSTSLELVKGQRHSKGCAYGYVGTLD